MIANNQTPQRSSRWTLIMLFIIVALAVYGLRLTGGEGADEPAPTPTATLPANVTSIQAAAVAVAQAEESTEESAKDEASGKPKPPPIDHNDPLLKRGWWFARMYFLDDVLDCVLNAKTERLGECKKMDDVHKQYFTARNAWAIADREVRAEFADQQEDEDQ